MKKIISFVLTLALLVSVLAVMPVLAADSELVGTDVTLTEGISLNFYIKADTDQQITNATPTTVNGTDCYKLTVGLGAKNMGDSLSAQLKNGDLPVGETFTSSVKGYADAILASTYDKATIKLVNAMLGYGAAAQNYFGYNTSALVGVPATDLSALNAENAHPASVTGNEEIYLGASLVLEGSMLLRFYFIGNDLYVTKDGEALPVTNKNGYCYADVAVMPNEIRDSVTVRCGDTTVTYSALNYLKSKASVPSLSEMVASIYAYGIAAEEYVRTSSCGHEGLTYDKVVQLPTLFNGGINEGYCDICGGTLTETQGNTEADVKKYNPTVSGDPELTASYSDSINLINDVLKGDLHFYPDAENGYEGRALYLEFSFLYNDTLANNDKGFINLFKIGSEGNKNEHTLYLLSFRNKVSGQWCPYAGGFETGDIDSAAGGIFNGPSMPNHASTSNETEDDYVFIGDYGWHRLGLRLFQTAEKSGSKVVYTVTASFFIDGECVSEYYVDLERDAYNNLLYTAKIDGDKLVYEDNDRNVFFYSLSAVLSSSTYYVATADGYATAVKPSDTTTTAYPEGHKDAGKLKTDDGFVLDVEPVSSPSPEDEKFKADGDITLDGTKHFKLEGDIVDVKIPEKTDSKKVLLISVDGLRPDAIANTEYLGILSELGSYTLSAQTIYPSKTMPAHMSMFHSVTPNMHGMNSGNVYAPSADLGFGITEALAAQGYTMAMFFDWENMQYLTKVPNNVERSYIQWYYGKSERYHERSTTEQTNAIIEHIENDPTDFTYLYFGMTDQMGHNYNWLSDEYYIAIEHIFDNILRILDAVSDEEYTVIITADHGGGGNLGANNHGSSAAVDMTTPVFIIGEGFEAGASLGDEVSILDFAPTIADILGAEAEDCWLGRSLASKNESTAKDAAIDLFLSDKAWSNYNYGRNLVLHQVRERLYYAALDARYIRQELRNLQLTA
ncbi:MAG: alkaline phosphatase family protein [Clostridia bacterium]|nr:alkaline phosphatase family protein [Clostridia bacterium]